MSENNQANLPRLSVAILAVAVPLLTVIGTPIILSDLVRHFWIKNPDPNALNNPGNNNCSPKLEESHNNNIYLECYVNDPKHPEPASSINETNPLTEKTEKTYSSNLSGHIPEPAPPLQITSQPGHIPEPAPPLQIAPQPGHTPK